MEPRFERFPLSIDRSIDRSNVCNDDELFNGSPRCLSMCFDDKTTGEGLTDISKNYTAIRIDRPRSISPPVWETVRET